MFFACGHISQSAVRAGNDIIAVPRGISGRNEKDELVRDRDAARDTRDIVSLREVVPGSRNRVVGLVQFSSSRFEACVSDTSPSFFPRSLSRVRLSRLVLFLSPSILLSLVECVYYIYSWSASPDDRAPILRLLRANGVRMLSVSSLFSVLSSVRSLLCVRSQLSSQRQRYTDATGSRERDSANKKKTLTHTQTRRNDSTKGRPSRTNAKHPSSLVALQFRSSIVTFSNFPKLLFHRPFHLVLIDIFFDDRYYHTRCIFLLDVIHFVKSTRVPSEFVK